MAQCPNIASNYPLLATRSRKKKRSLQKSNKQARLVKEECFQSITFLFLDTVGGRQTDNTNSLPFFIFHQIGFQIKERLLYSQYSDAKRGSGGGGAEYHPAAAAATDGVDTGDTMCGDDVGFISEFPVWWCM